MIEFRDRIAKEKGIEMLEYINQDGVKQGINPFDHGSAYTDIMKTQALKQALDKYGFTAAFGGGRRDEEKSRAKERIFSFRNENHAWDPKNQRPEMWKLYNSRIKRARRYVFSTVKLDREGYLAVYKEREYRDSFTLLCKGKTCCIQRRQHHHGR